jgi:hypothetical protein
MTGQDLERCVLCGDPVDRTGRSGRVYEQVTWFESENGEVLDSADGRSHRVGPDGPRGFPTGRLAHWRCVLDAEVADRWGPL